MAGVTFIGSSLGPKYSNTASYSLWHETILSVHLQATKQKHMESTTHPQLFWEAKQGGLNLAGSCSVPQHVTAQCCKCLLQMGMIWKAAEEESRISRQLFLLAFSSQIKRVHHSCYLESYVCSTSWHLGSMHVLFAAFLSLPRHSFEKLFLVPWPPKYVAGNWKPSELNNFTYMINSYLEACARDFTFLLYLPSLARFKGESIVSARADVLMSRLSLNVDWFVSTKVKPVKW